ncbi:Non-heme 11 kDa protein of cytochrome bc1 complex [Rhodofomes roseus]|uniref:Non-heme 11 kDa protein of cytochrome bc1 complex n=1 Tax=Rhodofomes roseus TaxID=34475 RepID=A0ABQ8KAS5_9APHY|nr:Non-heme 11 kDa protein of cytochrome bc1 complex [Rhodofomes roseus]KAH9834600.1 Non-heme 11 kDa protein of cytochrome bc1 complex [Rhodofomes roseus]
MSSLSSFFSSFLPTAHADAPPPEVEAHKEEVTPDEPEEGAEGGEAEEEEEEEPEDILPALREECEESAKCKTATEHFRHCEEKVNAGNGYQHEDCIEELCVMMHCVDGCVAPKLFAKLK